MLHIVIVHDGAAPDTRGPRPPARKLPAVRPRARPQ